MQIKKRLGTGIIALAIVVGTAGPAFATLEYVGGGKWYHDVGDWNNNGVNTSNYFHDSLMHGSTASNTDGYVDKSPCMLPGQWAYASQPTSPHGNLAYWNNSC